MGAVTVRGHAFALCALLCACLVVFAAPGCGGKTSGDTPSAAGAPGGVPPVGGPSPGSAEGAGDQGPGQGAGSGPGAGEWRTQVWRIWPGSPQLEYEGPGCFLGGFVADAPGKPAFLLLSPVALGSDAPAMAVVAPSATGEWRVVARLEDARDYHWDAGAGALVGVEGAGFCKLAPSGTKTTLYEGEGLFGADLLPADRGVLLVERGGGDALHLALAYARCITIEVDDVADVPPQPELGGRPLVPCRVNADGGHVAICGSRGGVPGVFIVDLASQSVTILPLDARGASGSASVPGAVAWAPGGDYVAVPGCGVYSVPGGELVFALGGGDTSPSWSKDGKYLLTGDAIIAISDRTRVPLADLSQSLHLPPSAQVRPLGWAGVSAAPAVPGVPGAPASTESEAFVVVTWPAEE